MNINRAPLYVIALPVLVAALALAGLPPATLILLLIALACSFMVPLMRNDGNRRPRGTGSTGLTHPDTSAD